MLTLNFHFGSLTFAMLRTTISQSLVKWPRKIINDNSFKEYFTSWPMRLWVNEDGNGSRSSIHVTRIFFFNFPFSWWRKKNTISISFLKTLFFFYTRFFLIYCCKLNLTIDKVVLSVSVQRNISVDNMPH
jgi:hypothetical protein